MLLIGLGYAENCPPSGAWPVIELDYNGGYLLVLAPFFRQVGGKTGQPIDAYAYAAFAGDDLDELERMVAEARTLVATQPEQWVVQRCPVNRAEFLDLLARWDELIAIARRTERPLVCWGDDDA